MKRSLIITVVLVLIAVTIRLWIDSLEPPVYGPWHDLTIESVELVARGINPAERGLAGLQVSLKESVDVNGTLVKKFLVKFSRSRATEFIFPAVHQDKRYILRQLKLSPVDSTGFQLVGDISIYLAVSGERKEQP